MTAPCASALRSAIEAWAANSWTSSNSSREKCASSPPMRAMLSVPMTSPATSSGHTIIDSGSSGVPGIWTERGS
jgi:hypothetical protein